MVHREKRARRKAETLSGRAVFTFNVAVGDLDGENLSIPHRRELSRLGFHDDGDYMMVSTVVAFSVDEAIVWTVEMLHKAHSAMTARERASYHPLPREIEVCSFDHAGAERCFQGRPEDFTTTEIFSAL